MQHLKDVSIENSNILTKLYECSVYIYYLIHVNIDKLAELDKEFLDDIDVPKDPVLRQLVTKYIHCFMDAYPHCSLYELYDLRPEIVVEELYNISQIGSPINHHRCADAATEKNQTQTDLYTAFDNLFKHWDEGIALAKDWESRFKKNRYGHPAVPWKYYVVSRNKLIVQFMGFLLSLITDWSSRVWVISEYHIAKKKNNLKYWFIGISADALVGLPFFKFDFEVRNRYELEEKRKILGRMDYAMVAQLNDKSFLEKILHSKASKNEDRFYAILPLSKYKDKINQVTHWNITTLLSVKLKLFEIMDTNDKLCLLFLIGTQFSYGISSIPTFATQKIRHLFDFSDELSDRSVNFDLGNKSTISIHHRAHESHLDYYLQLTPKKYSVLRKPHSEESLALTILQQEILCSHFQLDEHSLEIEVVRIDLTASGLLDCAWDDYDNVDTVTVFNIY
ncbi:hypothetical protein BCR42DRAFT_442680 [Absidia repens]|uniref:Heterokaryon incompatibility domain-containing protein n=1 Tax=Absidia repens TaxID=90262 RepID=A0A1X2I1K4_9FUNG|nr:hypothetical protein BCR42DRAFT_442680 [Absidia repens]